MRSGLHRETPQQVLADNLKAIFKKRHLSARGVARAIGGGLSNKTVSNLVNGVGAPQYDTLLSVAEYLHIPLWQLLCPGIDAAHFGDDTVHKLVESFCSLSEIGRARLLANLEDAVLGEQLRHSEKNRKAT